MDWGGCGARRYKKRVEVEKHKKKGCTNLGSHMGEERIGVGRVVLSWIWFARICTLAGQTTPHNTRTVTRLGMKGLI